MQIGIDDLNPDLRLGVQAYSFLMTDRGPGSYRFSDFADVINARYDSPNARAIADAFRAVPDGNLTINPDRTVSVDLPDARAMALQQDVLSETPSVAEEAPAARGAQAGAKKEVQDKAPPRDFRQEFTDKVVAAIESGQALPWDKPWHTMQGLPRNAVSGKTYSGGNRVVLGLVAMEKGYNDPRWMTVKQANDLGGHVTKGEKGIMIERWDTKPFWKRLDVELSLAGRRVVVDSKRGVTPEGVHLVGGQTVDPARITVRHEERTSAGVLVRDYTWKQAERALDLLVGRTYVVFNAEQCNGLKLEPLAPREDIPVDVRGERLMAAMKEDGVRFVHQGSSAYYSPAGDLIALPPRDTFKSVEGYYGTALHEMGHATGAEKRLNREGITGGHTFGSEGYAKEELRAELFSAFMSAETGIPHDDDQHTAYLQSWAKALKNDKNEIFRAAAEAGKAVDYVLDKEQGLQVMQERQASSREAGLAAEADAPAPAARAPVPSLREVLEKDGWTFKPNANSHEKSFFMLAEGERIPGGKIEIEKIVSVKSAAQGLVLHHGWDDVPVPGTTGVSAINASGALREECVSNLDAFVKERLAKEHAHLGITAVRGQNEPAAKISPAVDAERQRLTTALEREDALLSAQPHELTFTEFSTVASVKKLGPEHGRQWEVFNGSPRNGQSLGFADGPTDEGALRQVHKREVNNALHGNQPDSPDSLRKSMPPPHVLAEYPDLQKRWAGVIDAAAPSVAVSQDTPDQGKLKAVEIDAPAAWASALVNRDESGLDQGEAACVRDWVEKQGVGWPASMSEASFMGRHEGLLTEMATYTFLVPEKDIGRSGAISNQPSAPGEPTPAPLRDDPETQKPSAYERAVQSFVKRGGTENDARSILDSEMSTNYSANNLACALAYHGFARPGEAEKLATAIIAEENKKMLDKEDRKAADLQGERPRQRAPRVGAELER